MAVHTTFAFDSSEHYEATRAATRLTVWHWVPWLVSAVAIGLAAHTLIRGWGNAPPFSLFVNVLPWLLLSGFYVALLPFLQRRAARTLPERDASVHGPQERIVDELGFHTKGNGVALDVPWHAMVKGVEADRFFLFYYSKQMAYYVPKRALSAEQTLEMRALMAQGLAGRATLAHD